MLKLFCCGFVTLALSLLGTLSGANENPPLFKGYTSLVRIDPTPSPFKPDTPIEFLDKLQINKSVTFKSAVRENEELGIKDLQRLSLNASVEEHWAYLPDKNLWYEISFGETPGAATIDFEFLTELIENNSRISIYHIHLRNYLKKVKKEQNIKVPETWLVVPSFPDVALMIYFNSIFNQIHTTGNMSWYVCSPLGRTEYSLSAAGREKYKTVKGNVFLLTYFYPDNTGSINAKTVSTFDLAAPHDIDDLVGWVNAQGQRYIDVEFYPYAAQEPVSLAASQRYLDCFYQTTR